MQISEMYRSGQHGAKLYGWRAVPAKPSRGTVCLVHGICEHSRRYEQLTERLGEAGYTVSAFDLRGHGMSSGRRGDTRFAPTFTDLDDLLRDERAQADGRPIFLYGHSLGGLIVLAYALERKTDVAGVIASGPALHTSLRENRIKVGAAKILGRVLPKLAMPTGLEPAMLSRDPAVVANYCQDPLVHKQTSLGLGFDALRAMNTVLRDAARFPLPLLLVHGGADKINYVSGSQHVADALGARATLRIYDGVLHQPHTDPDSERVFRDVIEWIDARTTAL